MMQSKEFFGGLVEIKPLLLTDQPATRPEIRARLALAKGEMAVLTDTGQSIRHLAYLELRPGQRRGDHYHKLRHEYSYVISGGIVLELKDLATGARATAQLVPGDLLFIKPGVAHALVPAAAGHALEFAAEPFDLSDVYPHPLT